VQLQRVINSYFFFAAAFFFFASAASSAFGSSAAASLAFGLAVPGRGRLLADLVKQLDNLKKQVIDHPEGKKDTCFLSLIANGLLHHPREPAAGSRCSEQVNPSEPERERGND